MTGIYYTPIPAGAAANANTFNGPLEQLSNALGTLPAEIVTARGGYGDLNGRLATLAAAGGNISTAVNGVHNAGWTEVVVDSSTGFIAMSYVVYALVGGVLEYNLVADIHSPTQLTLTTPIGTGGIADNAVIAMISASEYAAATVIPHGGTYSPTLPATMAIASQGIFDGRAYGAVGDKTADDTAAIQAAIDAAAAAGGGCVLIVGRCKITAPIRLKPKTSLRGNLTAREGPWSATTLPESEIYNDNAAGEDAIVICSDETLIDTTAGVRTAIPDNAGGEAAVAATNPYSCSIDNLAITGNAASGHGIRIGDPTDGHPVTGTAFNQYCTAAGYDTRVSGCLISFHGLDGIHMSGVPTCRITNNLCIMNGRYGLSTWTDSNGMLIEGNHIQTNTDSGCYLVSFWGSSFVGNTIELNCVTTGIGEIYVKQAQGSIFHGNYFEGTNALYAMIFNVDNHCISIVGNRFMVPNGIYINDDGMTGNTDFTVTNNFSNFGYVLATQITRPDNKRLFLAGNYSAEFPTTPYLNIEEMAERVVIDGGNVYMTGAFGCNTKTPQAAYATVAWDDPGAGTAGASDAPHFAALVETVRRLQAALIANGICS